MRANSKNPTLIQISSRGRVLGHLTCKEFRDYLGLRTGSIPEFVERFNREKELAGEPERVKQILNCGE